MKKRLGFLIFILIISSFAFAADIFSRDEENGTELPEDTETVFEDVALNQKVELNPLGIVSVVDSQLENNAIIDIYFLNESNRPVRMSTDYLHDVRVRYVRKGVEFLFDAELFQKEDEEYIAFAAHEVKPLNEAYYRFSSEELPDIMMRDDEPIWMEFCLGDNKISYNMKSQNGATGVLWKEEPEPEKSPLTIKATITPARYILDKSFFDPSSNSLYLFAKYTTWNTYTLQKAMEEVSLTVYDERNITLGGTWKSNTYSTSTIFPGVYTYTFVPNTKQYSPVSVKVFYCVADSNNTNKYIIPAEAKRNRDGNLVFNIPSNITSENQFQISCSVWEHKIKKYEQIVPAAPSEP